MSSHPTKKKKKDHVVAWTMPANLEDIRMKEWRVKLFRRVPDQSKPSGYQWEQLQARSPTTKKRVVIRVSLRADASIVFRHIQLRIRLGPTLTRRTNRVLVCSQQEARLRVLMLRFLSDVECREFCDAFVCLNRHSIQSAAAKPGAQKGEDGEGGTIQPISSTGHKESQSPLGDSAAVRQYLFSLLQDPDFSTYCIRLENCLAETEDGLAALQVLEQEGDGESY